MNDTSSFLVASDQAASPTAPASRPASRSSRLPQWQVLLHDDDVNDMGYVVQVLVTVTPVDLPDAVRAMREAHLDGVSLVLETHREHAELLVDQLESSGLISTMEPV